MKDILCKPAIYEMHSGGKRFYVASLDRSHHIGILRFFREMTVSFSLEGGEPKLISAWVIDCGESIVYEKDEQNLFEHDHPGVLKSLAKRVQNQN